MTTNKSTAPASSNPPTGINGGYDALNQLSREQEERLKAYQFALEGIAGGLAMVKEALYQGVPSAASDVVEAMIRHVDGLSPKVTAKHERDLSREKARFELYPGEFDVPGGVHKLEAEIIRLKAEIAALREANTVATSVADTLRREIQQLREEAKNEKS